MRIFLLLFSLVFFLSCNSDVDFNSEVWKKSGGENITLDTRIKMVNNLIESGILLKKSEVKIIDLIGKPSKINETISDSIKYFEVQEFYGWNIDPVKLTFLKITFDKNKKSKKVEKFETK